MVVLVQVSSMKRRQAAVRSRARFSGRRAASGTAARSHRKSPEKPMRSHPTGEVCARSESGAAAPDERRCAIPSAPAHEQGGAHLKAPPQ